MKKLLVVAVTTVAVMLGAYSLMGAAPTPKRITNITTVQAGNTFLPVGYNILVCDGWVHYKMVTTNSATVATTDPMVKGTRYVPSKPVYLSVSAGTQYLALLLDNGSPATCSIVQDTTDGQTGSFTTLAVSSTSALTGAVNAAGGVTVQGTTTVGVLDAGASAVNGTLNVTGAVVLTGATLQNDGVTKLGLTDAGATAVNGKLNVASDDITAATKTRGTCNLNAGSPSTCTATVNSGAICTCSNTGTSTNGIKCAVSSTTLTITGPNGASDTCSYHCMQ